jgi:hypothetical protein
VPCRTSTGTSIFGRSARKSVSHVSTHAYVAVGRGAGRYVEAGLPGAVADPGSTEDIHIVEVVEEALEERISVSDDVRLDIGEDFSVNTLRVILGLEHEGWDSAEQDGLAHSLRTVGGEVADHLPGAHRKADENEVTQVKVVDQHLQIASEGVVVITEGRLTRLAEARRS